MNNCEGSFESLSHDILDATGPLQVCTGQEGGCEAAVHGMRKFFDEQNVQGALLVDASNAFNTINRQATHTTSSQPVHPSTRFSLIHIELR